MAKDPAFLFYVSDFLTGTMFMNNEQVGIYIRLLCSQHQHGGIIDIESFESMVGTNQLVRKKFIKCETGFYNERLTTEMEKRNKKSNNLSEAAKETWKIRKSNTIVLQSHNDTKEKHYNSNTIIIQPVNVNEDVIINDNKIKEKKTFFREMVSLKESEVEKLKIKFGEAFEWALDTLENHKQSKGAKYKSDYHALLGWVFDKYNSEKTKNKTTTSKAERTIAAGIEIQKLINEGKL